jgi:prepilin-type N-terminal cleavage/methylation domain-containing protein
MKFDNPTTTFAPGSAPLRLTARRFERGYTATEVLVAMTLFAIGASGVVGMMRANVSGNLDARTLDVANNIARGWEDRLRRDASYWTKVPGGTVGTDLSTTRWLSATTDAPAAWFVPAVPGAGVEQGSSPAYDLVGRELSNVDANVAERVVFCTQLRLTWLVTGRVARAEVRVFWPRAGRASVACTQAAASGANLDGPNAPEAWRFVQTQTAIRGNFQ